MKLHQVMRFFRISLLTFLWLLGLTACQGSNPVLETASVLWTTSEGPSHLSPKFEYLRVEHQGRVTFLALGRREIQEGLVVEDWYSAQRELLQLRNGRIHHVIGMTHEIRAIKGTPASWSLILQATQPVVWSRSLDLMPGYRYGVVERITTRTTQDPSVMPKGAAVSMQWLAEDVIRTEPGGAQSSYKQWFAIDKDEIVYSVQCVGPDMCFKLQRWKSSTP